MTRGTISRSGVAALCLFIGACNSSEPESAPTLSGKTSRPTGSVAKHAEKTLPLYGAYIRQVPGVKQTKAHSPGQRLWGIRFLRHKNWNGLFLLSYLGRRPGTFQGRAYEYSSGEESLRVGEAAKPSDLVGEIGNFELVLGGYQCPPGSATYAWTRFDHNTTLRLKATQESCDVRRAILEGDWRFSD